MKDIIVFFLIVVVTVAHARYFDRSALYDDDDIIYDDDIIEDLVTPKDYGFYRDEAPQFGLAANGKRCESLCDITSKSRYFYTCEMNGKYAKCSPVKGMSARINHLCEGPCGKHLPRRAPGTTFCRVKYTGNDPKYLNTHPWQHCSLFP